MLEQVYGKLITN